MDLRRIVSVVVAALVMAGGAGACGKDDVDRGANKAADKASQAGKKAEKGVKKAAKDVKKDVGD